MPDRAVRVEIEYEGGRVLRAEGEDADVILKHWQSGEVMNSIHGFQYQRPVLKEVRPARTPSTGVQGALPCGTT